LSVTEDIAMSLVTPSAPPLDSIETMEFFYKDLFQQLQEVEAGKKTRFHQMYKFT